MQTLPGQNARRAAIQARTAAVNVLVCESHELYRIGLRTVLASSRDLSVVGEARSQAEAVDLSAELRPDVVLAGDAGPRSVVPELVRALSRLQAGVVILTEDPTDVPAILLAGARGCLPRIARPERIRAAVRAAAHDDAVLAAEAADVVVRMLSRLAADIAPALPQVDRLSASPGSLTQRQWDVAKLVAEGCSNAEIAARLHVGEATVKSHLVSVLRKLGLRDRTQLAIRLVRSEAA